MENLFNRTWAEVDIDNILHNVRVIKDTLTGNSKIIAVVKADAYGHGAVAVAKASGIKNIGLTGKNGGKMAGACDCSIVVPSDETFKIQELHLPIYHTLCLMLEEHFYEV